jgi:hypothetical protein
MSDQNVEDGGATNVLVGELADIRIGQAIRPQHL